MSRGDLSKVDIRTPMEDIQMLMAWGEKSMSIEECANECVIRHGGNEGIRRRYIAAGNKLAEKGVLQDTNITNTQGEKLWRAV